MDREIVVVLSVAQASVLKGGAQLALAYLERQERRQGQDHEHAAIRDAIDAVRRQFAAIASVTVT